MGPTVRSRVLRYGIAILAVAAALLARLAIDPFVGNGLPFIFFTLAVVAVAWHGGFGPSFVALVLGFFAVTWFFLPPRYSLGDSLNRPFNRFVLSGYVFLGLTIGIFSERLRTARRRAEDHAREADRRRRELEEEMLQRRRLEEELHQRAEQLAEADRRKDEFLATLGHELRNPLAPLRSAVGVMQMLAVNDPKLREARDVIDRQLRQLTCLVDDLLDVSRISRGKIVLQKEPIELAEIVARAVESSAPMLEARQHHLALDLPSEKVWLEADPARLEQVVANLLNNAAKYTPNGGRIRLSADHQGQQVVLRVSDNGVGIAPKMLPHVFDLFTQAEPTLDRSEGGLGIGLTLVRSLVEQHGGSVQAFSEGLGQGSEFVVRLPLMRDERRGMRDERREEASGLPSSLIPHPSSLSRRVLAVDDNADAVESLALLLGVLGHEVRTASDGPAALETAAAFRPDVVLLDIGLPGMDGYEVARRLRDEAGLKETLLVAVTGYGQEEDRRRAEQAGFDAHLTKPAHPGELLAVLAREPAGAR
jgi:signal transduction histidine kinase/ActR/RegA family two-component response regulator